MILTRMIPTIPALEKVMNPMNHNLDPNDPGYTDEPWEGKYPLNIKKVKTRLIF